MKVALKAANGLYVCAEQGGGSVVRANRSAIGPWETFNLTQIGDKVTLQTWSGLYLCAEGGGGGILAANRTEAWAWETFTLINGAFRADDGQHYICAEVGSQDPILNVTRSAPGPWETFEIVNLEKPDVNKWRGSAVIPGISVGGRNYWTPSYGCHDAAGRGTYRQVYKDRGYTHFPYNCAGLPYGSHYPELPDSPERVRRDLTELIDAGLVPVVFATDDRRPDTVLKSFGLNNDLIPIAVPCWEMNGPLNNDEGRMKNLIEAVRTFAPHSQLWLHFTPGHGSISYDEPGGWRWCQDHGTTGLLAQGPNYISNTSPINEGTGLETTAVRLAGMVGYIVPNWDGKSVPASWAGINQRTVKFEWGMYEAYNGGINEDFMRNYTPPFLSAAPHVSGFCDGGR